jgi:hypothetical protein
VIPVYSKGIRGFRWFSGVQRIFPVLSARRSRPPGFTVTIWLVERRMVELHTRADGSMFCGLGPVGVYGDGSQIVLLGDTDIDTLTGGTAVNSGGGEIVVDMGDAVYAVTPAVRIGTTDIVILGRYIGDSLPGIEEPTPPVGEVLFESASNVQARQQGTYMWNHALPDPPNTAVVVLGSFLSAAADPPPSTGYTITCAGAALVSRGSVSEPVNGFWTEVFVLLNPPGGLQSLAWDFTGQPNISVRLQSLAYVGVGSVGGFFSAVGAGTALRVDAVSAAGHLGVCVFSFDGKPGLATPSAPTQSERASYNASKMGLETQDGPGDAGLSFGLTLNKSTEWCGAAVDLVPA